MALNYIVSIKKSKKPLLKLCGNNRGVHRNKIAI